MDQTHDYVLELGDPDIVGGVVGIPGRDRLEHVFTIGSTGSGKTSTLVPAFIQDAQAGRAGAFFDIHGRNAPLLLDYIPREREVVYLDATDFDFPFAYNRLRDIPQEQWHLVVDSMMSALEHAWRSGWGGRMDYILRYVLSTLLPLKTATLFDGKRLMTDGEWSHRIVESRIQNENVRDFWFKEFPWGTDALSEAKRRDWIMPILDKIGQYAVADCMVNIIGQVKNKVDMREIMDAGKLLIVNLDKSKIGEKNAQMLGSLMMSDMYYAAMQRTTTHPFFGYADEFTQIATTSCEGMVSEGRHFGLHLHMAGQHLGQIDENISRSTRDAILGNCGTLVVFKTAAADIEILAANFQQPFEPVRLQNLERHEAYIRHRNDPENKIHTRRLADWNFPRYDDRDYHIAHSREKYATPREKVEASRAERGRGG